MLVDRDPKSAETRQGLDLKAEFETDPLTLNTMADALWFGLSFYEDQLHKPPYLPGADDLGDFLAAHTDIRALPLPARKLVVQRFLTIHDLASARSKVQHRFDQDPVTTHRDLTLELGVGPVQFDVGWGLFAAAAMIKSKAVFEHLCQESEIGGPGEASGEATGFFLLNTNFGSPPIPIIVIREEREDLREEEERIVGDIRHEDMHIFCLHGDLYISLKPGVYLDHPTVHRLIREQIPQPGDFNTLFSTAHQVRQSMMTYLQNEFMATLWGGEYISHLVLDDAVKPLRDIAGFALKVASHPLSNFSYAEICKRSYILQAEITYLAAYFDFLEQWSRFAVENYPHPPNAPGKPHNAFHWAGSRLLAVPEIPFDSEKQPYPKEHSTLLLKMIRSVDPNQEPPAFSPNLVNILGDALTNVAVAEHENQRIVIKRPFTVRTELFVEEELPQLGSIARAVLDNQETFALIDTEVPNPGHDPAVIQRVVEAISSKSDSPKNAKEVLAAVLLT